MIIETISGHETFAGGYETRVLLFHRSHASAESIPLFTAIKNPASHVQQIGSNNYILACEANKNHGNWNIVRYAVAERCFIIVAISKRLPGDFIKHTKQLLLHCRDSAALQRIQLQFSGHPEATLNNGHIEGRFDILPIEKFEELGIEFPDHLLKNFDFGDEDPDDFYRVQVIEDEVEPLFVNKQETLVTEKGNTVRVSRPRRKVFIGK